MNIAMKKRGSNKAIWLKRTQTTGNTSRLAIPKSESIYLKFQESSESEGGCGDNFATDFRALSVMSVEIERTFSIFNKDEKKIKPFVQRNENKSGRNKKETCICEKYIRRETVKVLLFF